MDKVKHRFGSVLLIAAVFLLLLSGCISNANTPRNADTPPYYENLFDSLWQEKAEVINNLGLSESDFTYDPVECFYRYNSTVEYLGYDFEMYLVCEKGGEGELFGVRYKLAGEYDTQATAQIIKDIRQKLLQLHGKTYNDGTQHSPVKTTLEEVEPAEVLTGGQQWDSNMRWILTTDVGDIPCEPKADCYMLKYHVNTDGNDTHTVYLQYSLAYGIQQD